MRMPPDHLGGDGFDHIAECERILFLRHAGMKHHLQQEIAEFVAEIVEIAARDGVGDFIGFLDGVGGDGRKFCSRSHGQPLPGVRSAAMISSKPEISREGVMMHRSVGGTGPGMPQDAR